MLLNKKQLFFRDLFRSRKMLSWLKKICWILFFLLCMIKLYAQSEVIPGLFTTYQQNGRILWVIPDSLLGRDMSLTTTILEGAGRKKSLLMLNSDIRAIGSVRGFYGGRKRRNR